MSEPMDEVHRDPTILRPGSMALLRITMEDYMTVYWPTLAGAVQQLLVLPPAEYTKISYEQLYTCVYKCVCKQFGERIYTDLLAQMSAHLQQLAIPIEHSPAYIVAFHKALKQYLYAVQSIALVFNYLNRFYVELKLRSNLDLELRGLFVVHVAEKHMAALLPVLLEANQRPFSVSPAVMYSVFKNLHHIKPEYAEHRRELFAQFLPKVLPWCCQSELDKYSLEAQQMQRDLAVQPDFACSDGSLKRRSDEDVPPGFIITNFD